MNSMILNLMLEGPSLADQRTYTVYVLVNGKHVHVTAFEADSMEIAASVFAAKLGALFQAR
jgi:hypothetical protein